MPNNDNIHQILGLDDAKPVPIYKRLWFWLLLILGGALIVLFKSGIPVLDTEDRPPWQFQTEVVKRGNLTILVSATGKLAPINKVEVGSEVSGIVKSVEADYNSQVQAGQVLARLDSIKLEAQVAQSQASLELAKAKLMEAQANVLESHQALKRLQQLQKLSSSKLSSEQDFDKATAAFKRAQASEASATAQIAQAQAQLKMDEANLTKTVIRSPINGIVLERKVEPGQTVAASLQAPVLFQLAEDLTQMVLSVNVDEADVGQVTEGQQAIFTVDTYPDRKFQAQITQVRYTAITQNNVVSYETLLVVDNKDLSLRPGMTATAEIVVKTVENTLLVPNAALRFVPPPPPNENVAKKDSGGLVGMLLPRMGGRSANQPPHSKSNLRDGKQLIWFLRNAVPTSMEITTGVSDGRMTEIISGKLEEGQAVLIDIIENPK